MDIGQEVNESILFLGEMVSRNSWSHAHQQIDWRTHNFFYFLLMDTVGPGLWANRRLAQLDLYPPESDGIDAERALHVLYGLLLRFYLFLCLLFHLPTLSKQASKQARGSASAVRQYSCVSGKHAHSPHTRGRRTRLKDSLPVSSHKGGIPFTPLYHCFLLVPLFDYPSSTINCAKIKR